VPVAGTKRLGGEAGPEAGDVRPCRGAAPPSAAAFARVSEARGPAVGSRPETRAQLPHRVPPRSSTAYRRRAPNRRRSRPRSRPRSRRPCVEDRPEPPPDGQGRLVVATGR
jgi:hypothetical protein